MSRHPTRGKGFGIALIKASMIYEGDNCVLWPLHLNPENGYGSVSVDGEIYYAHSYMCELVHGPRPTPEHHAAHSCHTRHCITKRHLSWKTPSENMLDKRENGTWVSSTCGPQGKFTAEQVQHIRDMKGQHTQAAIARMFGVTEATIRNIHKGRTYGASRTLPLRAQPAAHITAGRS